MSIEHILFLIDEEIHRLKQAHAILSETLVPAKRSRKPKQPVKVEPPATLPVTVTVLPARVPRQRGGRPRSTAVPSNTALSHAAPSGIVAVSATHAAKDRARMTAVTPVEHAPRWVPVRPKNAMTIDDLFGKSDRAGAAE